MENVKRILNVVKRGIAINVVPITDDYGPTRTNPDFIAIVASMETKAGCDAINEYRKKNGLGYLDVFCIGVLGEPGSTAWKLSSGRLREILAERAK